MCTADGRVFGSVAEALRMTNAGPGLPERPGCRATWMPPRAGSVLRSLGEIEAKFTAAHASVLARFDAADAHDSDGYGTSAAWLMAMTDMTRGDARAKVRRMRLLRGQPAMAGALARRGYLQVAGAGDRRVDQEAPGGAARGDDHDPGAGRSGRGVAG